MRDMYVICVSNAQHVWCMCVCEVLQADIMCVCGVWELYNIANDVSVYKKDDGVNDTLTQDR